MAEDLLDHWVRLIKTVLPENVWITSRFLNNDHLMQIDWKLTDDPRNPNRRSPKFEIIIKDDAIENYLDKNSKDRELSDIVLKEFIYKRYEHFRSDNDIPTTRRVPKEKWLVSNEVLNCKPSSDTPLGDQVKSVYQYQQ